MIAADLPGWAIAAIVGVVFALLIIACGDDDCGGDEWLP